MERMSEEINTGKRGISDTYVVIQGWMVRELGLRGNDLFVFAQIYNYSQDGKSRFYGSIEYLQSWTNSTRQGIIRNLENLLEKNLIIKYDTSPTKQYVVNLPYINKLRAEYASKEPDKDEYDVSENLTDTLNKSETESKQILGNNEYNNKLNNKNKAENNYSEIIKEVIDYLNTLTKSNFKANTSKTSSLIKARLKEGFSLEDLKKVVEYKYYQWGLNPVVFKNGESSDTYVRPSTLFNNKFENYLAEANRNLKRYTTSEYMPNEHINNISDEEVLDRSSKQLSIFGSTDDDSDVF